MIQRDDTQHTVSEQHAGSREVHPQVARLHFWIVQGVSEVDREVGVEGYTENHRGFTNVVDKLRKYCMLYSKGAGGMLGMAQRQRPM